MNRLPPSLLYLVIYNPTLKPPEIVHSDDEDAEEQAHVLFYTANDHAVSKDRVLRQVGLAKALTNFTTIFDTHIAFESVHSQSRRMAMVSPEPNYWIHACFELERTSRVSKKDEKGKGKQKETVCDYNEASLHDGALRMRLLLGYEAFKVEVTHGSFTSIMNMRGKEALELQLERFFTVWAWSWDFSRQVPFSDYLGIRVHPLSNQLTPLVEALEDKLPPHYSPLVLASSCIVASKVLPPQHSSALVRHFLSVAETRQEQITSQMTNSEGKYAPPSDTDVKHTKNGSPSKMFLGVPGRNVNMNVNMDVRKWNWHNYLSFGISTSTSVPKFQTDNAAEDTCHYAEAISGTEVGHDEGSRSLPADKRSGENSQKTSELTVDSQSLNDALSSDVNSQTTTMASVRSSNAAGVDAPDGTQSPSATASSETGPMVPHSGPRSDNRGHDKRLSEPPQHQDDVAESRSPQFNSETSTAKAYLEDRTLISPRKTPALFSETFVYLFDSDPLDTRRRLIRYFRHEDLLLALVPSPIREDDALDDDICQELADRSVELIERLKDTAELEREKIAAAFSSTAQSVLQKSQHVVAAPNELAYSSASFSATSWHLHEGKKALELDKDLLEIFSRGQNPQDWHLAKRGLGTNLRGTALHGEVYMEIGRKEASLVDVDNEIAAVIRRFIE